MENKNQRRIMLVDRAFQYRLILQFAVINSLIMVLFGLIFFMFVDSELTANLAKAHVSYQNLSDLLLPIVLTLSLLHILISSIIIAAVVLYASHKIAGPLYRVNQALKEVSSKNLQPFTSTRSGDQVKDLADSVSELAESLRQDIKKSKQLAETALELANDPKQSDMLVSLVSTLDEYRI